MYGEPLDNYFSMKSKNLFPVHGTDALKRLQKMLTAGRTDKIVEDENVISHSKTIYTLKN